LYIKVVNLIKNIFMTNEKPKVLIVEDDKFFRELMLKKFSNESFEVTVARDGKDALEYLEKNIPKVILLDLILPGLSGYEILALIKGDVKTKNIPVIILSNLGQQEEIDKAMSLGAVDFMVKVNFTLEEIAAKIQKFLTKSF